MARKFRTIVAATALAGGVAMACAPADPRVVFEARLAATADDIVQIRRDIHRHPELSGAESRTAGVVAERLRALGFEVRTGVGGHGVVGVISGSQPGPVVAFRADMDAVRSDAADPVAFPSEVPGVRHICGHDVHTAVGLALAEGFAAAGASLPGTVMLIFQPAEETATGARAMIDGGVFDGLKPEAIFAVHAAPLEVGQVATAESVLMPARDAVVVTVDGRRALAAVQQARRLLEDAGTIQPQEALGSVTGEFVLAQVAQPRSDDGTAWSVRAILTVSSDAVRTRLRETLVPALEALGSERARVQVDYQPRMIAGVTNAPDLVARAAGSVRRVLGDDGVRLLTAMVPAFSEDFGSFQEHVPGVMFFLGVSNSAAGTVGMPHSPVFVADEDAIGVGARAVGAAIFDIWQPGGTR